MEPSRHFYKYKTIVTNIPRSLGRIVLPASLWAIIWALFSLVAAILGFGHPWYLGFFIPVGAIFYFLVAWLLYLREDGLDVRQPAAGPDEATQSKQSETADTWLYARPDMGIIARSPTASAAKDGSQADSRSSRRRAQAILLVAALELAILSILLYSLAGVGATYGH